MARPLTLDKPRNKRAVIMMTEDEKTTIKAAANKLNMTASEYIREMTVKAADSISAGALSNDDLLVLVFNCRGLEMARVLNLGQSVIVKNQRPAIEPIREA